MAPEMSFLFGHSDCSIDFLCSEQWYVRNLLVLAACACKTVSSSQNSREALRELLPDKWTKQTK